MSEESQSLLEFPCPFPLKIIGLTTEALVPSVLEAVLRHAPDYDVATMETRSSTAGRYLSLTCTINATSRAQLDALYRELTSHPLVRMVL